MWTFGRALQQLAPPGSRIAQVVASIAITLHHPRKCGSSSFMHHESPAAQAQTSTMGNDKGKNEQDHVTWRSLCLEIGTSSIESSP